MEFKRELETMVSSKNLMNSYKLYFLKAIIMNISKQTNSFSFYELACWMCVYSYNDVCKLGRRIRPLDKLYDVVLLIIGKTELLESSNLFEVYNTIIDCKDKELHKAISELVNYVPYRLLAYLWRDELVGKADISKNRLIAMYSKQSGKQIYFIDNNEKSKIVVFDMEWKYYLVDHREELIEWIDFKINNFVWKEMG